MFNMRFTVKFLLSVLLLVCCAGCSTPKMRFYQGEQLSADKVAILQNTQISAKNVQILSINGKTGPHSSIGQNKHIYNDLFTGTYSIELMPGKYTLMVQFVDVTYRSQNITKLEFEAQAGRTYQIKDKLEGKGLFPDRPVMWVEDVTEKVKK